MTIAMPRQLPLALGHEPGYGREDLIVAASNRAAVDIIDRWPNWLSPVVVLAGPAGSGKTHLAAIWKAASDAAILDIADLGPDAIEKANAGPVLIDDIGTAPFNETGLFHLINAVRQAGTSLLMTSRSRPANWPLTLPDLASRMKAVTVVEISEPDDELLSAVIYKLFADRQVAVEPPLVAYLVSRIERSLSTANRVVDRLDHAALEQKCRITRTLAASVLAEMEKRNSE
ncbi:DnaA regulatory inactivator HdaA [Brucella sp. IR073]|uniref:DnaA regulatory inactivator HdaA n=1 Tax=unclassified Brucella TaxID=2632610 RepID=UPI003B985819